MTGYLAVCATNSAVKQFLSFLAVPRNLLMLCGKICDGNVDESVEQQMQHLSANREAPHRYNGHCVSHRYNGLLSPERRQARQAQKDEV